MNRQECLLILKNKSEYVGRTKRLTGTTSVTNVAGAPLRLNHPAPNSATLAVNPWM